MPSELYSKIYQIVDQIPYGKITSYKAVAKAAGLHRGAQVAGWALKALPRGTNIPWQRVVNQKGIISIINPQFTKNQQKILLEEEGIEVIEKDGHYQVAEGFWWYPDQGQV